MTATPKKKTSAKKSIKSTTYLREIEIRYQKRNVSSKSVKKVTGPKQIVKLFSDLQNETKEKMITVSLDNKFKIICFEVIAIGSSSSIYTKPFEAIRAAIAVNATSVIIVHNHPSGDPKPSSADKKFTTDMKKITDLGGMQLIDHIVVGDDCYYSFCEDGKL